MLLRFEINFIYITKKFIILNRNFYEFLLYLNIIELLCLLLGNCYGDSGASYWKTDTTEDGTEKISTVLGVNSYITGDKCGDLTIAHKFALKDILKWISQNWKK